MRITSLLSLTILITFNSVVWANSIDNTIKTQFAESVLNKTLEGTKYRLVSDSIEFRSSNNIINLVAEGLNDVAKNAMDNEIVWFQLQTDEGPLKAGHFAMTSLFHGSVSDFVPTEIDISKFSETCDVVTFTEPDDQGNFWSMNIYSSRILSAPEVEFSQSESGALVRNNLISVCMSTDLTDVLNLK